MPGCWDCDCGGILSGLSVMRIGALSSEKEWKFNIGRGAALQARRNDGAASRFSRDEEAPTMDPKTREPKRDRPKTERPPTTRSPKGGEGEDVGDVERAT